MKRGNDTSQLRPEEVEALNDADVEEAGTFKRANKEVLNQRKIYRISKPSFDQNSQQNVNKPSVAFSFPLTTFAPPAPPAVAGGFIQKPTDEKPTPSSTFSMPVLTAPVPMSNMINNKSSSVNDKALNEELDAYKSKMKKLNQTFLSWINKQAEDNIVTVWTDGMDDYIKYCKEISESYPKAAALIADEVTQTASNVIPTIKAATPSASVSLAAPVSAPAAAFSSLTSSSSVSVTNTNNNSNPFASVNLNNNNGTVKQPTSNMLSLPSTTTPAAPLAAGASPFSGFSFAVAPPLATSAAETLSTTNNGKIGEKSMTATDTISASAAPFSGFTGFSLPTSGSSSTTNGFKSTTSNDPFKSLPPAAAVGVGGFFQLSSSSSSSAPVPPLTFTGFQNPFSSNNPSATTTTATNGGSTTNSFQIPNFAAPMTGGHTAAAAGGGEDDEGGDDEGEPIMEPEKILRNEEDTDIQLYEVPCKLYRFNSDTKEWSDMGKGSLRVTKSPDTTGRQRIIIRNTMGKPLVNAYFYKDMTFELVKGNSIKFAAFVADEDGSKGMRSFLFKVNAKDVDNALKILNAGVQSCK